LRKLVSKWLQKLNNKNGKFWGKMGEIHNKKNEISSLPKQPIFEMFFPPI